MLPQKFVQLKNKEACTTAPLQNLQNLEHKANAFNLGDDAVICVVAPSSAVVVAGHGCRRDNVKPSGQRACWLGLEVDDN
jgi:hypothetical protein